MVDMVNEKLPYIKQGHMPRSFTKCENGDIAFADASEDTNDVAKVVEFLNCNGNEIVCGLHTIHGRDKLNRTIVGFKGYAFASCSFHKQIRRIAQGTKIYSINVHNFDEVAIGIPSKSEQSKIATLLLAIDKRIATQNKIIEKLESLIKGLAHKVSHKGKSNICISECLKCTSSTLQESNVLKDGTYPVYGANGIVGYLDNYNTSNEAIYIIKDGSGVGSVSYVEGKCSATGTLNILQAKEGFSLHYLYFVLKVFNFEPYKTGMAIPHIYFKDYAKAKIFCPSYVEQVKYAHLLSSINLTLKVEQHVLNDLNSQKKYLLHHLFI